MRNKVAQLIVMPGEQEQDVVGMYTGVGTVRLFDHLKHLKLFSDTVHHEIGHAIHDRLSDDEFERWSELHRRSLTDPDHYAIIDADLIVRPDWLNYGMVDEWEDFRGWKTVSLSSLTGEGKMS